MKTPAPPRAQKNPLGAGRFAMICGAPTDGIRPPTADDYTNVVEEEPTMMPTHSGTRSRVCHVPTSFPDPASMRRFIQFIGARQADLAGQPVILSPAEIAHATGIPEPEQIPIRQTLMLAGRLRLSAVGNVCAYALEVRDAHPME